MRGGGRCSSGATVALADVVHSKSSPQHEDCGTANSKPQLGSRERRFFLYIGGTSPWVSNSLFWYHVWRHRSYRGSSLILSIRTLINGGFTILLALITNNASFPNDALQVSILSSPCFAHATRGKCDRSPRAPYPSAEWHLFLFTFVARIFVSDMSKIPL